MTAPSDDELDALLRKVAAAPARPIEARFIDERYVLGPLIGEGTFGAVFEAFDRGRRETVALKLLRHASGEALVRFKREFRLLSSLVDPSFVRLYDLYGEGERWYFTMERVEGVRFSATLANESRLRADLEGLVAALRRLHAAGIVHRDVKPSNVLVEPSGRIVLLDFGLAHAAEADRGASCTAIAGTPAYVAPEVASGAPPSPASDWYAVGVMLYEALTGELPFRGTAEEILRRKRHEVPPPVRSVVSSAPADLADLCDRLLSVDPDARNLSSFARPACASETFIGRARQLAELEARVASDAGPVTTLTGASGLGKTAMANKLAERARASGLNVFVSRCYPGDHVPFAALDGVIDEVARVLGRLPATVARACAPRDAAVLARTFPVLRPLPGFDADESPHAADGSRSRLARALVDLVSRWPDRATWLIVIDDAQCGDADSAAVLASMLAQSGPMIRLVLVHRTDTPGPLVGSLASGATEVNLGPMDDEDATALVQHATGDAAVAPALVREAAGHPLLLLELARVGGGRTLQDVVTEKVVALSGAAQRTLFRLASAPWPVELVVLEHLGMTRAHLHELREAALVSIEAGPALGIRHDRIKDVVAASIDAEASCILHRELASAFSAVRPERFDALALHFERAGDLTSASRCLLLAARQATDKRAFVQARAHYMRLVSVRERAGQGASIDAALRIEMAEASARVGFSVEAAEGFLAASHRSHARDATLLRVRAAEQLLTAGHVQRGEQILDEQLRELGLVIPRTTIGHATSLVRDKIGLAVDRVHSPRTSEARVVALWSACRLALTMFPVRGAALGARLVRESSRPGSTAHARVAAAFLDAFAEVGPRGPAALSRALARLASSPHDDGGPATAQLAAFAEGVLRYFGFELGAAATAVERACRIGVEHGLGHNFEETTSRTLRSAIAFVLGDIGWLRENVNAICAELEERDNIVGWVLVALHRSWLSILGRGAAAATPEIDEIRSRWTSRGLDLQSWWFDFARAHSALVLGDGRTAWTLARPQARPLQERIFSTLMHRLEAQTLLARAAICMAHTERSPPKHEIAIARKIVSALRDVPSAWTRAHASCLEAGLASVDGERDATLRALRAARSASDDASMPLHAALVEDAIGRTLGGDEGTALVEAAERRFHEWRIDRHVAMASLLPGKWL